MKEVLPGKTKFTRRSLLGSAAAIGSGTAILSAIRLHGEPVAGAPAAIVSGKMNHVVSASSSQNIVETESGKIYGYSCDGVIGYRGIQYGATTAGKARFMPPGKPAPWTGVRPALYREWVAPQVSNSVIEHPAENKEDPARAIAPGPVWERDISAFMSESGSEGGQPSEDCLRLNVWTPGLDNGRRAVMFHIHGGAYTGGTDGATRAYMGENFARQNDVVVVTMAHRLGVLGFLNLMEYGEQYAASPNVSMLDLVAALQWVKTNIANFGGDPNRVMIFGCSGGGSKVGTLMGMPAAKGLFHCASIQSGSTPHQATVESSARLAHATLAELGITKDNITKLHTDFTFRQIVQAGLIGQGKVAAAGTPAWPWEPGPGGRSNLDWGPVVEGKVLPYQSWDPVGPEPSADVPMIVGTALNEMYNSLSMGDSSLEDWDMVEAKRHIAATMGQHTDHVVEVTQKLYPKATPFEIFSRVSAMRQRVSACRQAALKANQKAAPAYLYWWEWQSPMCDGRARASHGSELAFCLNNVALNANATGNTPEANDVASRMAGAWAAFAKTGNPNHPGIPKWEAYNDSVPTMRFDTKCKATNDPDGEMRELVSETMG